MRYEILNIDPPEEIRKAMEYEVEAERVKRQEILLSEAKKIAKVNWLLSRLMRRRDLGSLILARLRVSHRGLRSLPPNKKKQTLC